MLCVRNTQLETLHAGLSPVTRTGDYSDVFVTDADGRRIPWSEVSHIDEDEMRDLMRDIVNRLYTFHLEADDPKLGLIGLRQHQRKLLGDDLAAVAVVPHAADPIGMVDAAADDSVHVTSSAKSTMAPFWAMT